MTDEPVTREPSDLRQCARLLEEVRRTLDDPQLRRPREGRESAPIQLEHDVVTTPDDEERRCLHIAEP